MESLNTECKGILDSGIVIPSPPIILQDINRILADPDASIGDIAALVKRDAGISAAIFKMAASPAFGLRRQPDTVDQALSMMGLSLVADLVKGMMLRNSVKCDPPFITWFWERSDDIARYAASVASIQRTVTRISASQAHLTALFLDCGVPILVDRYPDYVKFLASGKTFSYSTQQIRAADASVHTDHALVGYMVAKQWKLPDFVVQTIRHHHDTAIADHQIEMMVAVQRMATHIHNVRSSLEDSEWMDHQTSTISTLGLTWEGLAEFEEEVYDQAHFGE